MTDRYSILARIAVTAVSVGLPAIGIADTDTQSAAESSALTAPTQLESAEATTIRVDSLDDGTGEVACYNPVYSPDGGAAVCFQPYGEHLYIFDLASDGHHPVARYYRSDKSGLKIKHANIGAGGYYDHDLSIPESGWINYQACNYENDTPLSCSDFSGYLPASP